MPAPLILTLVAPPQSGLLTPELTARIARAAGGDVAGIDWLGEGEACDMTLPPDDPVQARRRLLELTRPYPLDIAVQLSDSRRRKLLASDMDSTMIGQECIDELAAEIGCGKEVARITELAMQGKYDFHEALITRVGLLEGMAEAVLEKVCRERIQATPGARTLVATMKAHGAYTLLVSGGFTHFTGYVAHLLGFDAHEANRLEIVGGKLTGRVIPPILDKDAKVAALHAAVGRLGIALGETLAVGDGANDLPMLQTAGLGVAYRGKEIVREGADVAIDHGDLTALLYFQGYRRADFRD